MKPTMLKNLLTEYGLIGNLKANQVGKTTVEKLDSLNKHTDETVESIRAYISGVFDECCDTNAPISTFKKRLKSL